MQMPESGLPSHFGSPVAVSVSPGDWLQSYSPIETKFSYINNLPYPVTIVLRSGMRFEIPSVPSFTSNKFIIRLEISIQPDVKQNVARSLIAIPESSSVELKLLRECFRNSKTPGRNVFYIDYPIEMGTLANYGGAAYIHDTDCVVALCRVEEAPPHPHSVEGMRAGLIQDNDAVKHGVGFGLSIDIVDNMDKTGPKYLNFCGDVHKIAPRKDKTKRCGIYVVSNRPVVGELSNTSVDLFYRELQPEEIAKMGLFDSYTEALNFGDVNTTRKRELAEMEHNIQRLKGENTSLKQRYDSEMLEKERMLKEESLIRERRMQQAEEERAHAEHLMALRRTEMKDELEQRSNTRKDYSELIKVLPVIIVGIGAAIMALRGILKPAK